MMRSSNWAATGIAWLQAELSLPRDLDKKEAAQRRSRLALVFCLLAGLLSLAMALLSLQGIRRTMGLAPQGQAALVANSHAPRKPVPKASTASPTPTPSTVSLDEGSERAGVLPSTAKKCSTSIGASQSASCGFARTVARALPKDPSGEFTVTATSPTTGDTYEMRCTAGRMVVCSGGTSARVYVLY